MAIGYRDLKGVGGWLDRNDFAAFQAISAVQRATGTTGDVLEIGGFKGRSAIVLADGLAKGETLHVCDPFEDTTGNAANDTENSSSYASLSRQEFEANLTKAGVTMPEIHQTISTGLEGKLVPGSFRLVHVDGSHLEDPVRFDIGLAKQLLGPGGVIILDDYRSPHTPGVALAVWEAVGQGLQPILTTTMKLYGSWDPVPDLVAKVQRQLESGGTTTWFHQRNDGDDILHAQAPLGQPWQTAKLLAKAVQARVR
jgi:hypothetical protein